MAVNPEDDVERVPVVIKTQNGLDKQMGSIDIIHHFPGFSERWNSNEEAAKYLLSVVYHPEWLSEKTVQRPNSGQMFMYDKKAVKFRKDGYSWKRRTNSRAPREDHMKLKVFGVEILYGCYAHSDDPPTLHRRCYWLLQHPHIVLVHYLNLPDEKGVATTNTKPGDGAELLRCLMAKPQLVNELRKEMRSSSASSKKKVSPSSITTSTPVAMSSPVGTSTPVGTSSLVAAPAAASSTAWQGAMNGFGDPCLFEAQSTADADDGDVRQSPTALDNLGFRQGDAALSQDSEIASSPFILLDMFDGNDQLHFLSSKDANSDVIMPDSNERPATPLSRMICSQSCSTTPVNSQPDISVLAFTPAHVSFEHQAVSSHAFSADHLPSSFTHSRPSLRHTVCASDGSTQVVGSSRLCPTTELRDVTDFSPDWAYSKGSSKILISGNFAINTTTDGTFTCRFGDMFVPAALVQSGVLRCFCPPCPAGLVELQVYHDNVPVTKPVAFEYRHYLQVSASGLLNASDSTFYPLLVKRLQQLVDSIDVSGAHLMEELRAKLGDPSASLPEGLLCQIFYMLWEASKGSVKFVLALPDAEAGLGLLHLAALLGLSKCTAVIQGWRRELSVSADALLSDLDTQSQDLSGLSPLHWACARGHRHVVIALLQWDVTAVNLCDHDGRMPADLAEKNVDVLHLCLEAEQSLGRHHMDTPPHADGDDQAMAFVSRKSSVHELSSTSQLGVDHSVSLGSSPNASAGSEVVDLSDWRYVHNVETSSQSAASTGGLSSVCSSVSDLLFNEQDAPTVADWCEVLGDSRNVLVQDFVRLSVSADEQRQLYVAARTIQTAFRAHAAKRKQQHREHHAALLIQNWYRRYRADRTKASEQLKSEAQTIAALKIQRFLRRNRLRRSLAQSGRHTQFFFTQAQKPA